MPEDSTTPQTPTSCDCAHCTFLNVMARQLPAVPQNVKELVDAMPALLLNPEAREVCKRVVRMYDRMDETEQAQAAAMILDMDGSNQSLGVLMLDAELRDAAKSMIRAADRGDI